MELVPWFVPVLIYVAFNYVGVRWLGKRLADQPDQIKRITVNMTFCAIAGCLFAGLSGYLRFDTSTYMVMGVGVLNAFANIAYWRATKVSLSKTSTLSFGDDIVAMLLARLIVGDGRDMNLVSATGIALCITAGVLFWWQSRGKESSAFYLHVIAYSGLWGVATFTQRYFGIQEMPTAQFVFAWYLGSCLTMISVFLGREIWRAVTRTREAAVAFSLCDYAMVFIYAMGIITSLSLEYWAKSLAPQTLVQPILLVSEAVIPSIIGWTIFHEGKAFDRAQWAITGIGFLGVALLAVGVYV